MAVFASLITAVSASSQTLQLQLQQGSSVITVQDNSAQDSNTDVGAIVYLGAVGVLPNVQVFAAKSKPSVGTAAAPSMDLLVNLLNGSTANTLVVRMTDTDFAGVINQTVSMQSNVGGTASGSPTGSVQVFLDPSNTPFGTGGATCTPGPQALTGTAFNSSVIAPSCPVNGPFSLTFVETLNFQPNDRIGFDHELLVQLPVCGTIGDFVWYDANRNGVQDPGEPGLNGVRLFLESGGNLVATTTTGPHPIGGAAGYYQFKGVCAGTYSVTVDPTTIPNGYTATLKDVGNDATDNDSNGNPVIVVLPNNGDSDQTIDFGFQSPCTGSIGDFVWHDLNRNGVQDSGEPGIPGVTVRLVETNQTDVTDANGFYQFTGLCAGTYTVEVVTPPAGMSASPTNVGDPATDSNPSPTVTTLTADNSTDLTLDFGYFTPCTGKIGDYVWLDFDRDGVQDSGETGIQGVTVRLKDSNGVVVATAVTDGNGLYLFQGLCGGNYVVEVDPTSVPPTLSPSPSNTTTPNLDSNGSPAAVTLPANGTDLTIDFGYMPPCTGLIGNYVWNDANRNGIQDAGEPGIPGVQLELRLASDNSLVAVASTNATGFYQFAGLCANTYKVVVLPPTGYLATTVNAGADVTVDSNPNPSTVVLPAHNSQNLTIDFGFFQPAALGDFVWYDINVNGQQDATEPGIGGVGVTLRACTTNALVATANTNASGFYLFSNLVPGCYYVQFATPTGYSPTTANTGSDVTDSDSVGGTTGTYTLVAGQTNLTVDAGFYIPASLGDFVWKDNNSNGIQDNGEPGIAGVLVTLQRCDGSTVTSQNTDANGKYLFSNLLPGCYRVVFATPSGMTASPSNVGANDAVDSDSVGGVTGNYVLSAGENNLTVDAGFYVFTPICIDATFDFSSTGNSSVTGTAGNIRTFSAGGVNVNVSAFSRNKTTDSFAPAYLGRYTLGLGVTDTSENGAYDSHIVDNSGRDNYILFEFSQAVVVDRAYLAYVVGDSDVSVWIGNVANAFTNHINLNAATLASLGFTEINDGANLDRWADLNAGGVSGNVVVIAAQVGESTDGFKLKSLDLGCPTGNGCVPVGTVALTGGSATYGTKGNIRSYSVGGVDLKAAAFSRVDGTGAWDKAFLGAYSSGLGVTDTSEGDGSADRHTTDNMGGRDNYVMFVFSQAVEVSRAFLDYVGADSDITVWVGNVLNAYATPPMLSDALLGTFAKEENDTTSVDARWADFNAAKLKGNVLVIAPKDGDTSPEDSFKLSKLDIVCK